LQPNLESNIDLTSSRFQALELILREHQTFAESSLTIARAVDADK
jgi:hypothetical protein